MENSVTSVALNTELWLQKAKELYNLKQQIKLIEKMESELSSQLKSLQHNEPLSFGGMRYYYEDRIGGVDYGSIPELKTVNLDLYRKPMIRLWKLSVDSI